MHANRRNLPVLNYMRVEEQDYDVTFWSGSGNMVVLCMRNVSGHNYRNNSFIADLAMEQIPRYTERISSCAKCQA